MKEEWKEVRGFKGRYLVSNRGRIKSLLKNRILKTFKTQDGYHCINLTNAKGVIKPLCYVHILVIEAFISPRPKNYVCQHKDGNRRNNKVENLRWVTRSQSFLDLRDQGTFKNKLSNENVFEIRDLLSRGEISPKEISMRFGVTYSTILDIKRDKTHQNVKWPNIPRTFYKKPPNTTGIQTISIKLSKKDIIKIKKLLREKKSGCRIAEQFGVNPSTISRIKTGKKYFNKIYESWV